MVLYQGENDASDAEWEPYLEILKRLVGTKNVRIFAYTDGGRPTREQQQRLLEIDLDRWPIAVVSPSTAVRFIVSVFALETPAIRLFPPEQLSEACAYLNCTAEELTTIHAGLDRAKLAIDPSKIAGAVVPGSKAGGRGRSRPFSGDVAPKRR